MSLLKIAGGRVIDPRNDVDAVMDLWIDGGRIIDAPTDPAIRPERTIDARGDVVMPGGVDVHSHIAGPKVNAGRALRPEDRAAFLRREGRRRSGALGSVPTTFATGYSYAGLGYTTAIDAAVPPMGARHAHHEFRDTPVIDKAFLILLANNHFALERIHAGEQERLSDFVAWLLNATRGYGIKAVNPGGIEQWKEGKGRISALDDRVDHFGVTPRQILVGLAAAIDRLGLPHPLHVHGLNLGLPGNAATMLETLRALDGHRAHLAHVQFHSYGGDPSKTSSMRSGVAELAEFLDTHDGLSVDVGQVLFGETTSMTADGPVGQYLHDVTGKKWYSHDVEQETGCGVVPITYEDTNFVHALQWAIGLEWFLRVGDPWKVALSTDHPNGASFLAYPQIIAFLMDRELRRETLERLPARVKERCDLAELDREYTLSEIAIITRAGPARMLGLDRKGHLGPGADADVTIYRPDADRTRMFALPQYVIKRGSVVIDSGAPRETDDGAALHVAAAFDPAIEAVFGDWFNRVASIRFANYPVRDADVSNPRSIPARPGSGR